MWFWNEVKMNIIFIRHGKTKGNIEHRYVGATEESLCEEGIQTLMEYKEKDLYPEVDSIYISPQRRCMETARILYPDREYITCSDLRECNFGEFEYKNYIELKENDNYQKWIDSNGTMNFPNGEGVAEFKGRCQKEFEQIISSARVETAALIVHGGTIMSILHKFALPHKDYYDWQIGNGEGFIAKVAKDKSLEIIKMIKYKE
jgi:alpha-ribazole phosphatase